MHILKIQCIQHVYIAEASKEDKAVLTVKIALLGAFTLLGSEHMRFKRMLIVVGQCKSFRLAGQAPFVGKPLRLVTLLVYKQQSGACCIQLLVYKLQSDSCCG